MNKTEEELKNELRELQQAYDALKESCEKGVTERMLAENALSESERKYRLLAQNSSDVIWTVNNDYRFTYISPSIYHLRGLSAEQAMSESIQDTMTPESQQIVYQAILKGKENEQAKKYVPVNVEIQQYHSDGHLIWVELSVRAMVNDQGEKIGYVGISRDITRRKMAEIALRQREEALSKLNAEKDKFFSIIAHDLKSPFTAIIGFSELLTEHINNKDYAEVEKYAAIILQSSQHAFDLLTNLLDWARLQLGRMDYLPASFALRKPAIENLMIFESMAAQKSISLHHDIADELTVFADRQMISLVIRNLLSNAIKYTHEGGKISISAEKEEKKVLVRVNDNGVGLSSEAIEKLFKIDSNVSTPGTNNETGTGLGLILCREFVERNGGRIGVESKPGMGSSFYFTLPCD
mgnify:CR=1 FL=1